MMDVIFDWCVNVLIYWANIFGITYKEINVWVFVIIWPISRWRILPIPATFEQPKLSAGAAPPAAQGTGGPAATRDTANLLSARLEPSSPALPLALCFAAAVPVTWLQRRARPRQEVNDAKTRGAFEWSTRTVESVLAAEEKKAAAKTN